MKSSNSNDWMIPLLAAFAIYLPLSSTAPLSDQQSSAQPQSPALIQMAPTATPTPTLGPDRVPGEAAKLLCDFFGLEPDLDQNTGLNRQQKLEVENRRGDYCRIKSVSSSKRSERPLPSGYWVESLIATVPDPIDSRLDHQFDRALDAIQRAIGAAGYTFDRHWLPWDKSKTAAPAILPADPRTAQMATRHLRDPGVILFRGSKGLLLLFLVGETPTGGIHRVAFQNALRQIEELPRRVGSKTEEPAQKEPLRILGPSFSGSDDSLAILLKGWIDGQKPPPEVRIVSGSATSIDKDELLKKIGGLEVNFHSTVLNAPQASAEFYNYLIDRDPQIALSDDGRPARAHIALLSEAGTGHGQNIRELKSPLLVRSQTFPLHISQLRVEAAKSPLRNDATNAPAVKDANLPLPMSETGSPGSKDIAPLFSSLETVTMELALREMLSAIHRERIRYVGVSATDPQDRIFLVREIRKHCPNVMIFTSSTDLFYLHSESNPDFQGTLVISPYPLFGLNQLWTYPFEGNRRLLQFSTHSAQGIYNATLALLDEHDKMLEYGFPFDRYEDGKERYPALWLGIVGRNGIWPVKTFDSRGFKITEQSLESLKSEGVPPDVLRILRDTPDQEVKGMEQFLAGLKEVIGGDQTKKFRKLFLKHASLPAQDSYTLAAEPKADVSQRGKDVEYRFGLSGNFWSPTGTGLLLLIGILCLLLPLAFLAQLILFWGRSKVDEANPDQWREGRSKLGRAIIERILKIEREIREGNERALLRPLAWVRRGLPGQIFGDEEFYCYRLDRRINLMACCVSLLSISLLISGVAMLPIWARWNMSPARSWWKMVIGDALKTWWDPHLALCALAGRILTWLYQHPTLGALVNEILTWLDQYLALGALGGTILVVTLITFIWLVVSVIGWMKSGWRHFRGRIWVLLALGVGAAMIIFVGWGLIEVFFRTEKPEKVFFFLRAAELTSGVSVVLPGLLIGLAAFLSFFAALRRLNLAERMPCLRNPRQRPDEAPQFLRFDHERAESFDGLKALEDRVKEMIVCPIFRVPGVALLTPLIVIVYFVLFVKHFIPSVDGRRFDWYFEVAFCLVPLLLVWALMRFFWLWAAVKRWLRRLSWHPLISQYAARHSEEKRFASLPPVDLMTPTPTYTALSLSVRQARSFYSALKLGPEQAETRKRIKQLVEEAESELSLALESDAKGDWQTALRKRRYSQAALAELTGLVTGLLEDSWRTAGAAGPDAAWRDEGKFFLITHIVAFLQHIFAHLQNLVGLVTIGLLLIMIAAISYPFQPREPLLLFSSVAILTSVVVTLYIFVSASRDKTLSVLTGTAPGKVSVTRDLVFRVLVHAVVPVIALLGVQFPEGVRQIFSWLTVFEGKGN